jgi:hypothetical protein
VPGLRDIRSSAAYAWQQDWRCLFLCRKPYGLPGERGKERNKERKRKGEREREGEREGEREREKGAHVAKR